MSVHQFLAEVEQYMDEEEADGSQKKSAPKADDGGDDALDELEPDQKPEKPAPKKKDSGPSKQANAFDHISDLLANVSTMLEFIGRRKNLNANGLTRNLIQDINLILNKLLKSGLNSEVSDIDAENLVKSSVNVAKAKKIVDGLEKKMKDEMGEK